MEKINTNILIASLLMLIIGAGIGYAAGSGAIGSYRSATHMMEDGSMMTGHMYSMEDMMHGMMSGLEGKTGDAFDHAFIDEMIVHHQGAVQMAEAALRNAKHEEIKQLARAIIDAQTAEIAQMRSWARDWYSE